VVQGAHHGCGVEQTWGEGQMVDICCHIDEAPVCTQALLRLLELGA
jgi:hypothetical protein